MEHSNKKLPIDQPWTNRCPIDNRQWSAGEHGYAPQAGSEIMPSLRGAFSGPSIISVRLALRALVLINFVAVLAVLASLTHVAAKAKLDLSLMSSVALATFYFGWGAAMALLAIIARAAAELEASRARTPAPSSTVEERNCTCRAHSTPVLQLCALVSGLASVVLFACGILETNSSVGELFQR